MTKLTRHGHPVRLNPTVKIWKAVEPKRRNAEASSSRPTVSSLPKYTPPAGMTEMTVKSDFASSPFEWDEMKRKPGIQLWAIRIPADIKPSRLSPLSLAVPRGSRPIRGSLKSKNQSYVLHSAGDPGESHLVVDDEGRQPTAGPGLVDAMRMAVYGDERELKAEGGAEMEGGIRFMVPRMRKGGKLFVAPIPITKHLILKPDDGEPGVALSSSLPSYLSTSAPPALPVHPPGAKRAQPTGLLKFRNRAYGFDTPGPASGSKPAKLARKTDGMELDDFAAPKTKKRRESEAGATTTTPKVKRSKASKAA